MSVTLKDIAARCGVSATVVSAVLNHRNGRIGCSADRRQQIFEVASKLGYRPNLLARSMVLRRSPIVAVMLNLTSSQFISGPNVYFTELFPPLVFKLNEHNLEAIFAPYRDESDQLERLERLYKEGLVGGIITNLMPGNYQRIAKKISEINLPYMILGYPYGFDCHCVYTASSFEWLPEYKKKHGIKDSFYLTQFLGNLRLAKIPFPEDYYWISEPISIDHSILQNPENLIICAGYSLFYKLPVIPHNVIIIESQANSHNLPEGVPAIISKSSEQSEKVDLVAKNLADWMLNDNEPKIRKNQLFSTAKNYEFRL